MQCTQPALSWVRPHTLYAGQTLNLTHMLMHLWVCCSTKSTLLCSWGGCR